MLLWLTDVTCKATWDQLLVPSIHCPLLCDSSLKVLMPSGPQQWPAAPGRPCAESPEDSSVSLNHANHFTMNYRLQLSFWGAVGMGSTSHSFQFSSSLWGALRENLLPMFSRSCLAGKAGSAAILVPPLSSLFLATPRELAQSHLERKWLPEATC